MAGKSAMMPSICLAKDAPIWATDSGVRGRQLAMVAPSAVAIEVLQHGAQLQFTLS